MTRYLLDTTPLASYLFSRRGAMALISPWLQRREVETSILCWLSRYLDTGGEVPRDHAAIKIAKGDCRV
jgi:hypothetical protein